MEIPVSTELCEYRAAFFRLLEEISDVSSCKTQSETTILPPGNRWIQYNPPFTVQIPATLKETSFRRPIPIGRNLSGIKFGLD